MKIRVEEYTRRDGSSSYADWFNSLDAQTAAKIVAAKLRMELGNTSSIKRFSGIGEYIIDWGPAYRIYLARDGDSLIVLFGGGTKRGSTPTLIGRRLCTPNTSPERHLPRLVTMLKSERGREHGAYS